MRSDLPARCFCCWRIAVPGTGRCEVHTRKAWKKKDPSRQSAYTDPLYQLNRPIVLREQPRCHWRLEGCTGKSTTADHVLPVSRGGTSELSNLVGACRSCNEKRGSREGHRAQRQTRRPSR